jgi:hypothetical protein
MGNELIAVRSFIVMNGKRGSGYSGIENEDFDALDLIN